ncbi:uncharacterized protein BBA_03163 [Beauveria bassiana ARSEF 2860]|uniref:Uncharacterized protein n=1 Tax=Beauveria bassiana (strain ARSEF 2860) TaxID=655819 RepID=J4URU8_BEAB2|nr:uncharacterized protein BBA_03163 [Beauveria bassiana ARSEF 2860]EJP68267.1 hypothetical protein BBA_03163 [Beauveria bassiana ARSEF 2860]
MRICIYYDCVWYSKALISQACTYRGVLGVRIVTDRRAREKKASEPRDLSAYM